MRRVRWLMLVFLALVGLLAWFKAGTASVSTQAYDEAPAASAPARPAARESARARHADAALPAEVAQARALIEAGGPFPFDRDGMEFRNYEGRLPQRGRGWYHEYTVPTPGLSHRGARRIVTGGTPPREWWYTGDHYESFVALEGGE